MWNSQQRDLIHTFASTLQKWMFPICISCAEDSSSVRTFPSPPQQESVPLWHGAFWLQPLQTSGRAVLREHWAQSHGALRHVTPTRLLSVPCLGSTGREGSYCSLHEECRKKKSFWAEGWKRLAGLSAPGSSYYKWPYIHILHNSFHYLVKFHLSRFCYWQKLSASLLYWF